MRRILHANIAGRLIQYEREGMEVLGLEVAWHCIRGGRVEEAVPYLLRGARQALQRGAPHSVELALCSATNVLRLPQDKTLADLLVVEALEEQGEWDRSLLALELIDDRGDLNFRWRQRGLKCIAELALFRYDEPLAIDTSRQLLDAMDHVTEPFALATLARAISGLVVSTRRVALARSSVQALGVHDQRVEYGPARQDWLIARLRIQCLIGEPETLETALEALSLEMEQTKTRSSAAATLAMERGCVSCGRGRYEEALTHFVTAKAIARELGNSSLLASAHANSALCFGRLGQFDKQLTSGREALDCEPERLGSYRQILARYLVATANAMKGLSSDALIAAKELAGTAYETAAPWVIQVRHLYLADALWLSGKKRSAIPAARLGATGAFARPMATGFTGIHARWLVRCDPHSQATEEYLFSLLNNVTIFDSYDQLEIAWACTLLPDGETSRRTKAARELLTDLLRAAPPAIGSILTALGMGPPVMIGELSDKRLRSRRTRKANGDASA
jgi:tetratricopeptide (TPR) repeat protein